MVQKQIFAMRKTVTLTLAISPRVKVMIQLCDELSRSNMAVRSFGLDIVLECVHCDLDLWVITLGQGHDTLLGHGQQLCEILSRSNMAVRSCGPDMDIRYVFTVTLTFDIWP